MTNPVLRRLGRRIRNLETKPEPKVYDNEIQQLQVDLRTLKQKVATQDAQVKLNQHAAFAAAAKSGTNEVAIRDLKDKTVGDDPDILGKLASIFSIGASAASIANTVRAMYDEQEDKLTKAVQAISAVKGTIQTIESTVNTVRGVTDTIQKVIGTAQQVRQFVDDSRQTAEKVHDFFTKLKTKKIDGDWSDMPEVLQKMRDKETHTIESIFDIEHDLQKIKQTLDNIGRLETDIIWKRK